MKPEKECSNTRSVIVQSAEIMRISGLSMNTFHYYDWWWCCVLQFLDAMYLKYNTAARDNNTYIVNSCGWDTIPTDLGVLYMQNNAPGNNNSFFCFTVNFCVWATVAISVQSEQTNGWKFLFLWRDFLVHHTLYGFACRMTDCDCLVL